MARAVWDGKESGTRDIFVGEGSSGGPIAFGGDGMRREALVVDLRRRLRDVKQGRDGLLYLLTDEADAVMLRIEPAE